VTRASAPSPSSPRHWGSRRPSCSTASARASTARTRHAPADANGGPKTPLTQLGLASQWASASRRPRPSSGIRV
jgi:hypothetical protein